MNPIYDIRSRMDQISKGHVYSLRNATIPVSLLGPSKPVGHVSGESLIQRDLVIEDGAIRSIQSLESENERLNSIDLQGCMVWPCFVDCHTHLDKAHIWTRSPNPDGTFQQALNAAYQDRLTYWNACDLSDRMNFGLRQAYFHGTCAVRSHFDIDRESIDQTLEVLHDLNREWSGRIELQFASLHGLDILDDPKFVECLAKKLQNLPGGVMGAFLYEMPDLDRRLEEFFVLAERFDLDIDLHADENLNPNSDTLFRAAKAKIRSGYRGKVLAGHACSLSQKNPEQLALELEMIAHSGISIVSLPLCNLYLQDRGSGRTPRQRGVAPVHECMNSGIDVGFASDNVRDPFHAYGDMDMFEVFQRAVQVQHLDHPFGDWPRSVNAVPSSICGFERSALLQTGAKADLVLFNARNWTELLSRPQSDRLVLRNGHPTDAILPDFRELDHLKGVGGWPTYKH